MAGSQAAFRAVDFDAVLAFARAAQQAGVKRFGVVSALGADAQSREIPIIIMSAADESEAMIKALDAGAEDYLPKPVSAAELRAKHLVAYQRGRLRVLDWAGLEAAAQGVAPPNHNAARV